MGGIFDWQEFERSAPDLAARGKEQLDRFRFVLVGTVRRDGTPRISAVESHIVAGHLALTMMPDSLKARDLLRDPRILVHTPVTDASAAAAAFQLRGIARPIEDQPLRQAVAGAIQATSGWRPADDWHFFTVDIENASFVAGVYPDLSVTRWIRGEGFR
jgi:hypothetical protein